MRRTLLTAVLAAAAAALAVPSGTAAPARADTTAPVSLSGFSDMVVDEAHGHVFLSQGSSDVVVTDLTGGPIGTVGGLAGAGRMVLSDDGSKLYIALAGAGAVEQVSTADPLGAGAVTTLPVAVGSCPTDVAQASGLLWVAATCDHQAADLYALDPADGSVHVQPGLGLVDPTLFASPLVPDTVFAGSDQDEDKLSTTGGATPTMTLTAQSGNGGPYSSFGISPDGSMLVNSNYGRVFTEDFAFQGVYYTGEATSTAVAQRASDGMVAFGYSSGPRLFTLGTSFDVYRGYDLGPGESVAPAGLAFGATDLYAVTYDGATYRLRVFTPRIKTGVVVETRHPTFAYGAKAKIGLYVVAGDRHAPYALYATHADGHRRLVSRGTFGGHRKVVVSARVSEQTLLTLHVDQTATATSATDTFRLRVHAGLPTKFVRTAGHAGKYTLFHADKNAYLLGKVQPDHSADCLTFHVQFHAQGHWGFDGRTDCVSLHVRSEAIGYVPGDPRLVGIPIRMRAEWKGDHRNLATNSHWRYCRFVHAAGRSLAPTSRPAPVAATRIPVS